MPVGAARPVADHLLAGGARQDRRAQDALPQLLPRPGRCCAATGAPSGCTTTPRRRTWPTPCSKGCACSKKRVSRTASPATASSTLRLRAGLEKLGLLLHPAKVAAAPERGDRFPQASTTWRCAKGCSTEYGIEIGAGLGPFKGRAWRIGIMGASCTAENVDALLKALGEILG